MSRTARAIGTRAGVAEGTESTMGPTPRPRFSSHPGRALLPPRRLSDTRRASCITVEAIISPGRGQNYCCHWTPRPCPPAQGSAHAAAEAIVWTGWTPCPPQLRLLLLCVLPPSPSRLPNVKPHLTHPRSQKDFLQPETPAQDAPAETRPRNQP